MVVEHDSFRHPPVTEPTPQAYSDTHIRSFVHRRGHLTTSQRAAWETGMPQWGIPWRHQLLDLPAVFGRAAPVVLEIGFGMGETTAHIAAEAPDTDFIGVEVYTAGCGALLRRIDDLGLRNLRLIQHDAIEVLRDMIAPASLARIQIFFPDPWPKARHHKRRLIRPEFVSLLADRLVDGGVLHCATDWAPYAEVMQEVLSAEPLLRNQSSAVDGFAPRPAYRPETRFEARGVRLGHSVFDLVYQRSEPTPVSASPVESSASSANGASSNGSAAVDSAGASNNLPSKSSP